MKRIKFLLILAAALMSACGPQSGDKTESATATASDAERTLVVSQGSDILSLDPYAFLESPTFCVLRNVFDPLTDTDANLKLTPCLAESWENKSPAEWIFHLREGVTFHDGQPFDASDAVFSLRRAIDWPKSRVGGEIPAVDTVEAIDALTLRIVTKQPDPVLPLRLGMVLMMDAESAGTALEDPERGEAWLATHANGTGPYRVEDWRRDDACDLTANENYWGGAPAPVRRMRFAATANDATRMAELASGGVDILVNVPPRSAARVEKTPGYTMARRPSMRLIYLGVDSGRDESPGVPGSPPNPLRKLKVREAIACAINRPLIVEKVMAGNARAAYQLMPEAVTGYDPNLPEIPCDPERAKTLLAEAGYPDGFEVRLDGPNDRYVNDAEILQAIAAQLARVGIKCEINAKPKASFFAEERAGNCSLFLIGWSNSNGDGAPTFEHLLHTPADDETRGASNTSTCYGNPELDRISELAATEFDPNKREMLLRAANRMATLDLPHIPLHFQMDLYAVSDRIAWSPRCDTQVRGVEASWK